MHIGLLATQFLINIGANDFLKNIIRGLSLERGNRITFIGPSENTYEFYLDACPWMDIAHVHETPEALANLQREREIDVFLPSIFDFPLLFPYATYWPDCQPKHYPEFFDDESQRVRDERILALLASGNPMIINSRDAKQDMIRFYKADPGQIFELPFAPIIELDKLTPRPELLRPYGLSRPYFIVCNQFWIHKSIETAIAAARVLKDRGVDAEILFTGRMAEPRKPGYIEGLHRMVEDLGVGSHVRFLGYIPKDDQLELMKHAVAVLQTTLFEGGPGGGAVYDAVSLGQRAIVSDIPINHELPVDPKRLVLFKSKDAKDAADKMQRFLAERYEFPTPEDLYQQSRRSAQALSGRLYQALDYALSPARMGAQLRAKAGAA